MTQPPGEAGSPAWRDLEAAALLEHARWIGSDLAQRVDAMTQRAGVLLAATLALSAIWVTMAPSATDNPNTVVLRVVLLLAMFGVPAWHCLSALRVRTYHSIGPADIEHHLAPDGRPTGQHGPDIHAQLLSGLLCTTKDGDLSVLRGLENDIAEKKSNLTCTEMTLVIATVVAPIIVLALP